MMLLHLEYATINDACDILWLYTFAIHQLPLYLFKSTDEFHGHDWKRRYRIIKGVCEGLKYLHEGFEKPMYHLDLKPDNILLDENMTPKLADFGSSKLFGEEQSRVTHSTAGTM
jgi:serine/threonine protein kinase